uniref:Uncharacterized protein n=1 Tax=Kalanchoe fedtschenkoi TaxID=63787 RepID=A0A7N0ZVC5_KALFE
MATPEETRINTEHIRIAQDILKVLNQILYSSTVANCCPNKKFTEVLGESLSSFSSIVAKVKFKIGEACKEVPRKLVSVTAPSSSVNYASAPHEEQ